MKRLLDRISPITLLRWILALLAIGVTLLLQSPGAPGLTDFGDAWIRDHFIRLQASDIEEPRVAVIDIDEASLLAIGPWPWPRHRIADLVENLLAAGARGVALDLVLPEPGDAKGDLRLQMLARHGPVVLGQVFDYIPRATPLRVGHLIDENTLPANVSPQSVPVNGYIANYPGLAASRYGGNIGFVPDADGTLRRLPLLSMLDGRLYPTLSLALFNCCARKDLPQSIPNTVAFPSATLPPDFALRPGEGNFLRLAYPYNWSAYTVVSAVTLLQTPDAAPLAGKLVLIGSSALGLDDQVPTPLSASTAGVMVHAAALSGLLDQAATGRKHPVAWPGQLIAIAFSALVALLAALGFPRLSALTNVAMLGIASLFWLVLAYWLSRHDALFSTTGPLMSNLFLLAIAVPFDWQVSQLRSRRLLGTLHQYVARPVVDELLRSNTRDPLHLKRVDVTTLIADMQDFTGQVESLSIDEAAQMTRDFLDCLTRPILKHHGTLDKYTGDGVMAFWGAPLAQPGHADQALDAAQDMLQEIRAYNLVRTRENRPPLRVRIGVESGIAMAGDFGTSFRSVYTAVGDSVNIASRLEKLARDQPHDLIIGEGAASRCKRHKLIFLGDFLLRGKEKPTSLYTLALHAPALTGQVKP